MLVPIDTADNVMLYHAVYDTHKRPLSSYSTLMLHNDQW